MPSFSDNLGQTMFMVQAIQTRRSTHYLKSFKKHPMRQTTQSKDFKCLTLMTFNLRYARFLTSALINL